VEVDWSGRIIYGKREIQLALISSLDSNYKSNWNPENDYSREDWARIVRTEKIPLYLNGVKVFGMSLLKLNRRRRLRTDRAQHRRRLKSLHWRFCTNTEIQRQLQKISEAPLKLKYRNKTGKSFRRKSTLLVYQRRGFKSGIVCDYAHLSESMITAKFVDLENPVENAEIILRLALTAMQVFWDRAPIPRNSIQNRKRRL